MEKFHQNPEMINIITRSIHPDAIVDSLDHSNEQIADRVQHVISKGVRQNTRAPMDSIQVSASKLTPSTLATAGEKSDATFGWLDSFSINLLKAFKDHDNDTCSNKKAEDTSSSVLLVLSNLRDERRKCWQTMQGFEEQLKEEDDQERCQVLQKRLHAENESLEFTARSIQDLEQQFGARNNKRVKPNETAKQSKKTDGQNDCSWQTLNVSPKEKAVVTQRQRIFAHMPILGLIYDWIQVHQDLFSKKPVGPIAAEILPESEEEATLLERNSATNAALKSFIVHSHEDYVLLYRHVRELRVQRLPINIICHPINNDEEVSSLIFKTLMSQVDLEDETFHDLNIHDLVLHFDDEAAENIENNKAIEVDNTDKERVLF
jgi:hypothetical protein